MGRGRLPELCLLLLAVSVAGGAFLATAVLPGTSPAAWDLVNGTIRGNELPGGFGAPWPNAIIGPLHSVHDLDLGTIEVTCLHLDRAAVAQWARVALPPADATRLAAVLFAPPRSPADTEFAFNDGRLQVARDGAAWRLDFRRE